MTEPVQQHTINEQLERKTEQASHLAKDNFADVLDLKNLDDETVSEFLTVFFGLASERHPLTRTRGFEKGKRNLLARIHELKQEMKNMKPLEDAVNIGLVSSLEDVVDILLRERNEFEAKLDKLEKKFGKRLFKLFLGKMRVSVEWKREKRKSDL